MSPLELGEAGSGKTPLRHSKRFPCKDKVGGILNVPQREVVGLDSLWKRVLWDLFSPHVESLDGDFWFRVHFHVRVECRGISPDFSGPKKAFFQKKS